MKMSRLSILLLGIMMLTAALVVVIRQSSEIKSTIVTAAKRNGGYYVRTSQYQGGLFSINADDPNDVAYLDTISGYELPSSFSPDGEWIAFHSSSESERNIFKVRIDGSERQQLTFNGTLDSYPSWSPDGHWIVYISMRDTKTNLYRMRPDGSQKQLVVENVRATTLPEWSPNGRWLAVVLLRDTNWDIYRLRIDGSGLQRLTNNPDYDGLPKWSPDGRSIAYFSTQFGYTHLYSMDVSGENQLRLTLLYDPVERPMTWSPDSQWIAFEDTSGNIVRMRKDGTDSQKLTDADDHQLYPSWSPDGAWIAYISTSGSGISSLHKMRPDGTENQIILSNYAAYRPLWSPKIGTRFNAQWLILASLVLIVISCTKILWVYRNRLQNETAF